jgi:hypothetical protein
MGSGAEFLSRCYSDSTKLALREDGGSIHLSQSLQGFSSGSNQLG